MHFLVLVTTFINFVFMSCSRSSRLLVFECTFSIWISYGITLRWGQWFAYLYM